MYPEIAVKLCIQARMMNCGDYASHFFLCHMKIVIAPAEDLCVPGNIYMQHIYLF